MQFTTQVTSLEDIYKTSHSSLWSHKRFYTTFFTYTPQHQETQGCGVVTSCHIEYAEHDSETLDSLLLGNTGLSAHIHWSATLPLQQVTLEDLPQKPWKLWAAFVHFTGHFTGSNHPQFLLPE